MAHRQEARGRRHPGDAPKAHELRHRHSRERSAMIRRLAATLLLSIFVSHAGAQAPGAPDSALVARILLAEDRRDISDAALEEGVASPDPRIQLIARRAIARIGDPKFASRDSFPTLPAPPTYKDPAWRLRYRALHAGNCGVLRAAVGDSVWHVRLHEMDLAT